MTLDILLDSLELENILGFESLFLDLSGRGLSAVDGENLDNPALENNGSGKTSLGHGLTYGLFGKDMKGRIGDKMLNRYVRKNGLARVRFHTSDRGSGQETHYIVSRFRRHAKFKNELHFETGTIDLTVKQDVDATQAKIEEILGMDWLAWTTAVCIDRFRFISGSDAERKEILDRILGYDQLRTIEEIARRDMREAQTAYSGVTSELAGHDRRLGECDEGIRMSQANETSFSVENERSIQEAVAEIKRLEGLLAETDVADSSAQLAGLRGRMAEIDEALKGEAPLFEMLRTCETESATHSANHRRDSAELANLEREQRDLASGRLTGTRCAACKQPITAEFVSEHLMEVVKEIASRKERLAAENDLLAQYREAIRELNEAKRGFETLKTERGQLVAVEPELVAAEMKRAQELSAAKNRIENLRNNVHEKRAATNPHTEYLETERTKRKKILQEKIDKKAELERIKAKLADAEFWVTGFGNAGIKSLLLDHVMGPFTEMTREYTRMVTDDQITLRLHTQKELKSKDEKRDVCWVEVANRHGGEDYLDQSGGETARIDICAAIGLNDLAASRSNRTIRFLFLDEPFEKIDAAGWPRIMRLLKKVAETRKVLVVSHLPDLRMQFDKRLLVRRQGDVSRLVEA